MKIYNYPSKTAEKRLLSIANRDLGFKKKDLLAVTRIIEDVKKNGDKALIKYVNRFDSSKLKVDSLKVTREEFDSARGKVGKPFMRALNRAFSQIEAFHKNQVSLSWMETRRPGTILGQLVNPVDSVGVYVPGGQGGKTPPGIIRIDGRYTG